MQIINNKMKVLKVIKQPKYLAIAIVSIILMTSLYLYSQVLGNIHNLDIWFDIIPWYNALLFTIFAILFGVTLSYQIYVWKQPKVCKVSDKVKGVGTSSAPTFGIFLVAQCPACASYYEVLKQIHKDFGGKKLNLPNMNWVETRYLCLPINPKITKSDVRYICAKIKEFYRES